MTRRRTKTGAIHSHSRNTQDFPPPRRAMPERAAWKFCNVVALMPSPESAYYTELPPSARLAVDACKRAAAQLEPAIKSKNERSL